MGLRDQSMCPLSTQPSPGYVRDLTSPLVGRSAFAPRSRGALGALRAAQRVEAMQPDRRLVRGQC
jgi:hypothetical protein